MSNFGKHANGRVKIGWYVLATDVRVARYNYRFPYQVLIDGEHEVDDQHETNLIYAPNDLETAVREGPLRPLRFAVNSRVLCYTADDDEGEEIWEAGTVTSLGSPVYAVRLDSGDVAHVPYDADTLVKAEDVRDYVEI